MTVTDDKKDTDVFDSIVDGVHPTCDSRSCDDEAVFQVLFVKHDCRTDGRWWLMCEGHMALTNSGRAHCMACRVGGRNSFLAVAEWQPL
jgi:hypothetical protein